MAQSPRMDTFRAQCAAVGRYAGNKLVLPGIIFLLFTLVFATPIQDWAEGKKQMSGAWADALANAAGLLANPVVRLILFLVALFFFARGAREVVRADAINAADVADVQSRIVADAASQIKTDIADSARLSSLFARAYVLQDALNGYHQALAPLKESLIQYQTTLADVEHGTSTISGRRIGTELQERLTRTVAALRIAHQTIAGQRWDEEFHTIGPNLDPLDNSTGIVQYRFDPNDNAKFLLCHNEAVRVIQEAVREYELKISQYTNEVQAARAAILKEATRLYG